MKLFFTILLMGLALTLFSLYGEKSRTVHGNSASTEADLVAKVRAWTNLKGKEARQFAIDKNFNTDFFLLANLAEHSGKARFYIYCLNGDSVIQAALVTHGRCNEQWLEGRKYSNVVGSGCSSPGKYKIGASYFGRFGLAYKLHGLESTNNNAYKRYVVLHAHECVPNNEIFPENICQSDGCPTVAPEFLQLLSSRIKKSSKPVLLWLADK